MGLKSGQGSSSRRRGNRVLRKAVEKRLWEQLARDVISRLTQMNWRWYEPMIQQKGAGTAFWRKRFAYEGGLYDLNPAYSMRL